MRVVLVVPRLWNVLEAVVRRLGSKWPGREPWEALLSRGQCEPFGRADLESTILDEAGVAYDSAHDIPVAALSRLGDGLEPQGGLWLRADPVSLRADRDQLVLVSWDLLDLNAAEAAALANGLTPLFDPLGWRLYTPVPQRWYLQLPEDIKIRTYTPRSSFGTSILGRLPTGPDSALMRRVLTEVQMTLHTAAENRTRIEQQKPPVNSVWFWGAGAGTIQTVPFAQQVWSDDSFLIGLARHAQVPQAPLPLSAQTLSLSDGVSWFSFSNLDRLWRRGEVQAIADELEQFREIWVVPLIKRLGRMGELVIISDTGARWTTSRHEQTRWWVRRQTLEKSLARLIPNSGAE